MYFCIGDRSQAIFNALFCFMQFFAKKIPESALRHLLEGLAAH